MAGAKRFLLIVLGFVCVVTQLSAHSSQTFLSIPVLIGEKTLLLAHADSPELRQHGLAHQRVLCDDCGMLFEYEKNQIAEISTQDTFLPVDIAFVRDNGTIVKIVHMLPFDDKAQSSAVSVRYVIEMNRGWFKRQGIKVGDKIGLHLTQQ